MGASGGKIYAVRDRMLRKGTNSEGQEKHEYICPNQTLVYHWLSAISSPLIGVRGKKLIVIVRQMYFHVRSRAGNVTREPWQTVNNFRTDCFGIEMLWIQQMCLCICHQTVMIPISPNQSWWTVVKIRRGYHFEFLVLVSLLISSSLWNSLLE